MSKISFLLTEVLFLETEDKAPPQTLNSGFNLGPLYHGGTWDGKTPIKVNGRGALGTGAYLAPSRERAQGYAKESGGNKVIEVYVKINKPLDLNMGLDRGEHPCIKALVLLGMKPDKAERLVERVEEQKGYMGKEISNLAQQQGYDGLCQYVGGELTEVVVWNAQQVSLVMGQ